MKSVYLITTLLLLIGVINNTPLVVASIRLPATTHPIHYDLHLNINVDQGQYSGSVAIRLNVTSANVNLIALNYHELQVSDVLIYRNDNTTQLNLLSRINFSPTSQIIEFSTNTTLVQSSEYVLRMNFNGTIRNDLKGLYSSSYWINGTRRNIATTFFAPHYARMAFPCYDEPEYKATFDVQITNNVKYHALANTAPSSYMQSTDNVTTVFQRTPKMSTYLVAFIVSDLVPSRGNNSIAVWAQESRRSDTAFALTYAHQVRTALQDYLGLPYQMDKLDLVAVDDFLMGAMENWGLITFASNRLLADDVNTTTAEQQGVLQIVAHEVAHQWFGNLVTCSWWDDIWLNEGFATYMEDVIADKVANQWLVLDQFVVAEKLPAMRKDADRTNNKAMSQQVTTLEEISAIYDFVAYPKAGSVLRMFHHVVGDRIFQQTLQEYLTTYQYANVQRKDFFGVLERVAGQLNFSNPQGVSLSEAYENWAQNFGFPLVTVDRDYNRGLLRINQTRFVHSNYNSYFPSANFFVPLRFATKDNPNIDNTLGLKWLTPSLPSLNVAYNSSSWILVNPNATGYYRVNYDQENWNRLSQQLHATNSIPMSSRVQLIDDVMTLARFGHVPYSIALNLIQYIKTETYYTPVAVALGQLEELDRSVRGLQVNMTGLVNDILETLYRTSRVATTHVDKLRAAEVKIFACKQGYDLCIQESHVQFEAYLQRKAIDADWRRPMFCGSVQSSGLGEVERFRDVVNLWMSLARSEYERVLNERHVVDILDGFSCLRNETNMQELLTYSLRNDFGAVFMTTGDRLRIFSAVVSGSTVGTGLGLETVRNNWNVAVQMYGSSASIYTALGPNVVTPAHVTIFNEIVFTHMRNKAVETIEPVTHRAVLTAVRQVEENVQFLTNHREQLTTWFKENYPASSAMTLFYSSSRMLVLLGVLFMFLWF